VGHASGSRHMKGRGGGRGQGHESFQEEERPSAGWMRQVFFPCQPARPLPPGLFPSGGGVHRHLGQARIQLRRPQQSLQDGPMTRCGSARWHRRRKSPVTGPMVRNPARDSGRHPPSRLLARACRPIQAAGMTAPATHSRRGRLQSPGFGATQPIGGIPRPTPRRRCHRRSLKSHSSGARLPQGG
jgi:hypothetical protein